MTTSKKAIAKKAPPRKPRKESLAKHTAPAEVNDGSPRFIFLPQRAAGVRVTEESAMTLGAVWACFPAGTLVTTADGKLEPIEDVTAGSSVVSHSGKLRTVTETISRSYSGTLCSLRRWGATDPICVTADHLFYVVRRPASREWWSAGWRDAERQVTYEWVKACDLDAGDFLTEPIRDAEIVPGSVDIKVRQRAANVGTLPVYEWVNESVRITPVLFRLLGYYLAEGWCEDRAVRFALHEDEAEIIADITAAMAECFGVAPKIYPDAASGHGTVVAFNSTRARAFFCRFGANARDKFLPEWAQCAPFSWQAELLAAYWKGDGCHRGDGYNISSAGRQLIECARQISLRLGMVPSLRVERRVVCPPGGRDVRRTLYTLTFTGKNAERFAAIVGESTPCSANRGYCFIANGRAHYPIRSVDKAEVSKLHVYNLEVEEDHSYLVSGVSAHNCVRVISESLAGLPSPVLKKRADGGRDIQYQSPVHWLLNTETNPETPAFQWKETMYAHALTWGNGYSEIERDAADRIVWAWQITPDRVQPERWRGRIIYDVWNPNGPNTVLEASDMFHLRGLGFDGLVGYPVIRLAARSIGLGIAAEEAGSGFFGNDSTPGGILEHPGKLSPDARDNIEKGWAKKHGGPNNRRVLAILEEGMKWQATSLPPEDAQLVQQLQLTPANICRWFRVPPHKIADLSRSTFSNIENESIAFVTDCLMPWARRMESEADVKFFGRTQRGTVFTRVNFNGLLRGDVAARTALYVAMADRGVYSVNDILELEDRNPIGPDGDKRFVPLNMQLLEKAGEEPPPVENPPPPEEPENEEPDDKLSRIESASVEVLRDAVRRVLKREGDARHLSGEELAVWQAKQRTYATATLSPPAKVLAELHASDAESVTRVAVALFLDSPEPLSDADAATAKLCKYISAASAAA